MAEGGSKLGATKELPLGKRSLGAFDRERELLYTKERALLTCRAVTLLVVGMERPGATLERTLHHLTLLGAGTPI